jgi:hypothetical protein
VEIKPFLLLFLKRKKIVPSQTLTENYWQATSICSVTSSSSASLGIAKNDSGSDGLDPNQTAPISRAIARARTNEEQTLSHIFIEKALLL